MLYRILVISFHCLQTDYCIIIIALKSWSQKESPDVGVAPQKIAYRQL